MKKEIYLALAEAVIDLTRYYLECIGLTWI